MTDQPERKNEEASNLLTGIEALGAVDFEIDRITKEGQKPGWNDWAIYGVIAIILWSLVTYSWNQSIRPVNIAQIFFSLQIFFGLLSGLRYRYFQIFGYLGDYPIISRAYLSRNRLSFLSSPSALFTQLVLNLILTGIVFFASAAISWFTFGLTLVWLILIWSIHYRASKDLFFDLPRLSGPPPRVRENWAIRAGEWVGVSLIAILTFWIAYAYFRTATFGNESGANVDEIKVGLLMFALMFSFEKMFFEQIPKRVLYELIDLRRKIALKELISGEEALHSLKRILARLTPAEFVKDFRERYDGPLAQIQQIADDRLDNLTYLLSVAPDAQTPERQQEQNDLFLASIEYEARINEHSFSIDSERIQLTSTFNTELKRLKKALPFELEEIKNAETEIRSSVDAVNEALAKVAELRAKLVETIQKHRTS